MAWLPMYLVKEDLEILNEWLNGENEIAFIVPNGSGKWIAKKEHIIQHGLDHYYNELALWHIPSGPLPLIQPDEAVRLRLKEDDWKPAQTISDPWLGWTELVGSLENLPRFDNYPGIIHLSLRFPDQYRIYISHFGWIGNYYSIIGNKANPLTGKFWVRMRKEVKKMSTQIPRENDPLSKKEIYAFPNALKEIQNGKPCTLN